MGLRHFRAATVTVTVLDFGLSGKEKILLGYRSEGTDSGLHHRGKDGAKPMVGGKHSPQSPSPGSSQ